jgi:glycosyltransferase involved in cell wall biosynthesis
MVGKATATDCGTGDPGDHDSLRIAVLAHALRAGGGISVGQNLLAALGRVAPQHRYFATIPEGLGYEQVCRGMPQCESVAHDKAGGLLRRWGFERFTMPRAVHRFRPDIVLGLGNAGLFRPRALQAILFHNPHIIYPIRYEYKRSLPAMAMVFLKKLRLKRHLRHTQWVWCQTDVAVERFRKAMRFTGHMGVCPNAVSQLVHSSIADPPMPEAIRAHSDRFKLFLLSRYYEHKNFRGMVRMFRCHSEALKNVVVFTTVSPEHGSAARGFLREIEKPPVRGRIVNVGPLKQQDLAGYYLHCDALFLPTVLESFSGTYLEAMHFGMPILTSDLDFAHAVCGDAAIYFDPSKSSSMCDAIVRLSGDPGKARDLVEKGRHQLPRVSKSWDEIATDVVGDLHRLAAMRHETIMAIP